MLWNLWEAVLGYLEKQRYWSAIQPFVLVGFGAVAVEAATFEYVRRQYGATPPSLFLRSYLSTRILIVSGALLLLMLLLRTRQPAGRASTSGRLVAFLRTHRRRIVFVAVVTALIASAAGLAIVATSPSRLSRITIRVMDLPADVKQDALTYLVYELNRPQRQWYFEIDSRPFNELALTSTERQQCMADSEPTLCYAERTAETEGPLIALTAKPLKDAFFATHRGLASVITTADVDSYAPLTNYEYLAYLIVLQSVLLQLDAHGGLPPEAFAPGATTSGDVFAFVPTREMLKASLLAPRLSPRQEALIFNRFGPAYLGVTVDLLSLDWLYTPRVKGNFEKLFSVTLSR
ncbi:MAG TPA: hypothetical protein VLT86_08080 [Vicinamibacterales bacterium]|nr:hypothetical protein [Vicinamibacterales bacterium]